MLTADVIRDGVAPNLERLLGIWSRGFVAILFFRVDPARVSHWHNVLGWSGKPVQLSRMTKGQVSRLVNGIDAVCANGKAVSRWLRGRGGARLLVVLDAGQTMCLNFDEETGFTCEPGT